MKTNENNPTKTTVTANITLGLDLGNRRHSYCVLDTEGEILAEDQLVNIRECLEALSRRFSQSTPDRVASPHPLIPGQPPRARRKEPPYFSRRKIDGSPQRQTRFDFEGGVINISGGSRVGPGGEGDHAGVVAGVFGLGDQHGQTAF